MTLRVLFQRGGMILVGAAAAVALMAFVWWLRGQILQTRGELAAAMVFQQRQLALKTQHAALENELSRRTHDIGRIAQMVPAPTDLNGVLSVLESEAQREGVTVAATARESADEVGAEAGAGATEFRLIPIAITATGGPAALVSYLHAVEHMPYLAGIESFSLQTGRANSAVPIGQQIPLLSPPGAGQPTAEEAGGELSVTLLVAVRELTE